MKILFVTTLSGKKINNFMLSSILAAKNIKAEYHLACNTNQVGFDVYQKECNLYGIKLHHIDFDRRPLKWKNIKAYKQLKEIINKEQYDIIHVNTPVGGVLGRLAARKSKNSKVIYTAHGFHFYQGSSLLSWLIYYNLEKTMSKTTDLLITVNEEDYQISKKMKANNILKINGVGFNRIENNDRRDIRVLAKINPDAKVVVSVGELNKNKNHIDIVRNLDKINAYYVILGVGDQQVKLTKIAKKLNCLDRLIFLGYRTDVIQLIGSANVFVLPSHREGLSISLMEAMSLGLPCVVSDIRGNRDLIHHEKGGYLVKKPSDYSKYINQLLDNSDLSRDMGTYNIQVSNEFTLEKIVSSYTDIYLNMVK